MTTPPSHWLDDTEQAAWRAHVGSHARLMAELNRRLVSASGLSIGDYEVLVHLSEAPGGTLRPFVLAEALRWERSRLTHQVSRMERRGLVARRSCDEDDRGSLVAITTSGRRALRRAAPNHVADVRELFVEPAGSDLTTMASVSARVDAAIERTE